MIKLEKLIQALGALFGMTISWVAVGLAIWHLSFLAKVAPPKKEER